MRNYVVLAAILVLVGAGVAAWLLPDPREWSDIPLKDRIPLATLIVGLLALAAALVTILAAVAEVRQVFPTQTVRVSTTRREYISPETSDERVRRNFLTPIGTYQLIFEIPSDSPIINTLRIYVRLVHSSEQLSDANWRLQQTCECDGYLTKDCDPKQLYAEVRLIAESPTSSE